MSKYDDIINLSHHVSNVHPPMPMMNRAAQFAPFAALTGHAAAIEETGRLTVEMIELGPEDKERLSRKLTYAHQHEANVIITFFLPDNFKRGGRYVTCAGIIKKIEEYEHAVIMSDGYVIPISMIYSITGNIYADFE